MPSDATRTKTLWSETQLEMLYLSLEKDYPDARVKEIVADLVSRGLPETYLVEKAQDKCGAIGASRLRKLLKSRG